MSFTHTLRVTAGEDEQVIMLILQALLTWQKKVYKDTLYVYDGQ